MNKEIIRKGLEKYDEGHVTKYIKYLEDLENKVQKNKETGKWESVDIAKAVRATNDNTLIELFISIASVKLFIDGEVVILTPSYGRLSPTFTYHAYKNLLYMAYPETKFDLQLVKEKDEFNFEKIDGVIKYYHKMKDPFARKVKGVYCIIKNKRGHFIEFIGYEELQLIRKKAKVKAIWDEWENEMYLKSTIKRACKRHFKDHTMEADKIDNENFDLSKSTDKAPQPERNRPLELFEKMIQNLSVDFEDKKSDLVDHFKELDYSNQRIFYGEVLKGLKTGDMKEVIAIC